MGKPQLLTEVRLVDVGGRDVADGECGEILFRGPNITPGYYNNPEATAAAISSEGWLRSGDIGRRDGDGYYFIVDRIKDMYISGGENVYPAEVEAVLTNHAAVLEAAVIGVADARWGVNDQADAGGVPRGDGHGAYVVEWLREFQDKRAAAAAVRHGAGKAGLPRPQHGLGRVEACRAMSQWRSTNAGKQAAARPVKTNFRERPSSSR